MAEICLIKVGRVHYIHLLLRPPATLNQGDRRRFEVVEGALIATLICMRAATIADQQERSAVQTGLGGGLGDPACEWFSHKTGRNHRRRRKGERERREKKNEEKKTLGFMSFPSKLMRASASAFSARRHQDVSA